MEEDSLEHKPLFETPGQKECSFLGKEGRMISRALARVGQLKFSQFEESSVKDGSVRGKNCLGIVFADE